MLMRGGEDVGFGKQQCIDWYLVTLMNGMEISSTYLYTTCSSSGGGGGGRSNSGSGGANNNDIKSTITNPCLKILVNDIISKGIEFTTEQTLNSIFGSNSKINLTFAQANYSSADTDGSTTPPSVVLNSDQTIKSFDITLKLNEKTMPNAAKEYISATVIHETLHAYFSYRDKELNPTGQHNEMATDIYVAWFINAIKNIYPTISDFNAKALAWGGLEDTAGWDTFRATYPYDAGQITLANDEFHDGELGTKCSN